MSVSYAPTKLRIPPGFEHLLEVLAREVLREQPEDIIAFAAEHFRKKLLLRDGGVDPMEQSQERSELSTPPQQDQASSAGINAPVTAEGEAKVIATETEEDTPASIEDGAEVPSGREEEGGGSEKEEEGRREEGGGSEEEERESGEEEGGSGEELVESGGVETGGDQVTSEREEQGQLEPTQTSEVGEEQEPEDGTQPPTEEPSEGEEGSGEEVEVLADEETTQGEDQEKEEEED